MGLVAIGLLLIVARIVLNRSNEWLIRANLITLTATLYTCSLINLAPMIAEYNVSHGWEASGKGSAIDMNYLFRLGPQALPAIDRAIALARVRSDPCFPSWLPCRTATEGYGFLAHLGLSKLAAAANPGRPTEVTTG